MLSAEYGPPRQATDDLGAPVEVLQFPAAEVARVLDTSAASVNSALQRARKTVDERVPHPSQQAELAALGLGGQRELVDASSTPPGPRNPSASAWWRAPMRSSGTASTAARPCAWAT